MVPFSRILLTTGPTLANRWRSGSWTPARLAQHQHKQLEGTLEAAWRIPFYRSWLGRPRRPEDLAYLPVLGREEVLELSRSVRAVRSDSAKFIVDTTSGSEGPVQELLFDESHQRGRYAARLRFLLHHGWTPASRTAWIIYVPSWMPRSQRWEKVFWGGSLLLSIFEPESIQVERLRDYRPRFLLTYPSNLEALTDYLQNRGERLPSVQTVFTWGELLRQETRKRARAVLGVDVFDIYGSAEAQIAWECRTGTYHQQAEHVLVEILDGQGSPVGPGEVGRVVLTTLENRLMPLVRCALGDYALAPTSTSNRICGCGSTLPEFGRPIGRALHYFERPEGRCLDPEPLVRRLQRIAGLGRFQVVQSARTLVELRVLATVGSRPAAREEAESEVARWLGQGVGVSSVLVSELPKERTGKWEWAWSTVCRSLPRDLRSGPFQR